MNNHRERERGRGGDRFVGTAASSAQRQAKRRQSNTTKNTDEGEQKQHANLNGSVGGSAGGHHRWGKPNKNSFPLLHAVGCHACGILWLHAVKTRKVGVKSGPIAPTEYLTPPRTCERVSFLQKPPEIPHCLLVPVGAQWPRHLTSGHSLPAHSKEPPGGTPSAGHPCASSGSAPWDRGGRRRSTGGSAEGSEDRRMERSSGQMK